MSASTIILVIAAVILLPRLIPLSERDYWLWRKRKLKRHGYRCYDLTTTFNQAAQAARHRRKWNALVEHRTYQGWWYRRRRRKNS